jgi:hypothetical protein
VLSNRASLVQIRRTVRSLQSTVWAISLVGSLLRIITSNWACWEVVNWGAIVLVSSAACQLEISK